MPKISVIIPTFNRERFVPQAVESIVRQSFRDYEIIVVDDGSTDHTQKALEPYAGRILYHYQTNAGVSAARNAGIRLARGEWVAFLDSDDEWDADYLSRQMEHVQRFPKAVMHITNAIHIVPHEELTYHFQSFVLRKFKGESSVLLPRPFSFIIHDDIYWFVQSSIMRRELLLKSGLFDETLSIAEDLDVIARMALSGPVTLCRAPLVMICRRTETVENLVSQLSTKTEYCYRAYDKVYTSFLTRSDLTCRERLVASRICCTKRRALANTLLRDGRKLEARESYGRSLRVYPSIRSFIKYLATFLPHRIALLFARKKRSPKVDPNMNS